MLLLSLIISVLYIILRMLIEKLMIFIG